MKTEVLLYGMVGLFLIILLLFIVMLIANKGINNKVDTLARAYNKLSKDAEVDNKQGEILNNNLVALGNMISQNQKTQAEALDRQLQIQKDGMDNRLKEMSERLEAMYKNLGEMQSLATGVNDLKKVLTNVKARGVLGEAQLGLILEQILSNDQYGTNVETVPNSHRYVEYAVKFPGDGGHPVWLPIDSKFPGDTYGRYRDIYETGNKDLIDAAWKELEKRLKEEAKDIKEKYIEVPYTTDFGIMFLPFEGLYSEAVNHNMVEVLQRDYKVTIAGPTTMAVLLNSFQMGFRTLAIEKHSSEVWELLGAVKTEFSKYSSAVSQAQTAIRTADKKLEELSGTRTRAVERKLRSVEALDNSKALDLLELDELKDE